MKEQAKEEKLGQDDGYYNNEYIKNVSKFIEKNHPEKLQMYQNAVKYVQENDPQLFTERLDEYDQSTRQYKEKVLAQYNQDTKVPKDIKDALNSVRGITDLATNTLGAKSGVLRNGSSRNKAGMSKEQIEQQKQAAQEEMKEAKEKEDKDKENSSLGYGEIQPGALQKILYLFKNLGLNNPSHADKIMGKPSGYYKDKQVIVDVGSGVGKTLLQLALSTNSDTKVVGLELDPPKEALQQTVVKQQAPQSAENAGIQKTAKRLKSDNVISKQGNFRDTDDVDKAQFVYSYDYVFSPEDKGALMKKLSSNKDLIGFASTVTPVAAYAMGLDEDFKLLNVVENTAKSLRHSLYVYSRAPLDQLKPLDKNYAILNQFNTMELKDRGKQAVESIKENARSYEIKVNKYSLIKEQQKLISSLDQKILDGIGLAEQYTTNNQQDEFTKLNDYLDDLQKQKKDAQRRIDALKEDRFQDFDKPAIPEKKQKQIQKIGQKIEDVNKPYLDKIDQLKLGNEVVFGDASIKAVDLVSKAKAKTLATQIYNNWLKEAQNSEEFKQMTAKSQGTAKKFFKDTIQKELYSQVKPSTMPKSQWLLQQQNLQEIQKGGLLKQRIEEKTKEKEYKQAIQSDIDLLRQLNQEDEERKKQEIANQQKPQVKEIKEVPKEIEILHEQVAEPNVDREKLKAENYDKKAQVIMKWIFNTNPDKKQSNKETKMRMQQKGDEIVKAMQNDQEVEQIANEYRDKQLDTAGVMRLKDAIQRISETKGNKYNLKDNKFVSEKEADIFIKKLIPVQISTSIKSIDPELQLSEKQEKKINKSINKIDKRIGLPVASKLISVADYIEEIDVPQELQQEKSKVEKIIVEQVAKSKEAKLVKYGGPSSRFAFKNLIEPIHRPVDRTVAHSISEQIHKFEEKIDNVIQSNNEGVLSEGYFALIQDLQDATNQIDNAFLQDAWNKHIKSIEQKMVDYNQDKYEQANQELEDLKKRDGINNADAVRYLKKQILKAFSESGMPLSELTKPQFSNSGVTYPNDKGTASGSGGGSGMNSSNKFSGYKIRRNYDDGIQRYPQVHEIRGETRALHQGLKSLQDQTRPSEMIHKMYRAYSNAILERVKETHGKYYHTQSQIQAAKEKEKKADRPLRAGDILKSRKNQEFKNMRWAVVQAIDNQVAPISSNFRF